MIMSNEAISSAKKSDNILNRIKQEDDLKVSDKIKHDYNSIADLHIKIEEVEIENESKTCNIQSYIGPCDKSNEQELKSESLHYSSSNDKPYIEESDDHTNEESLEKKIPKVEQIDRFTERSHYGNFKMIMSNEPISNAKKSDNILNRIKQEDDLKVSDKIKHNYNSIADLQIKIEEVEIENESKTCNIQSYIGPCDKSNGQELKSESFNYSSSNDKPYTEESDDYTSEESLEKKIPEVEPYRCDVCGKTFASSQTRHRHIKTHTGEKPYECKTCGKGFAHTSHLSAHIKIHTGERPFKCNVCHKAFNQVSNLNTHLKIHTGEKPFICTICDEAFNRLYTLQGHLATHSTEKLYQCDICSKSFARKQSFHKHMAAHTGEKRFQCNICGKSFLHRYKLQSHMKVHHEKPFNCNFCQKSFDELKRLQQHIRIHTGEKQFECDICQKTFNKIGPLRRHQNIHLGVKPFECNVCKRAFNVESNLQRHKKIHTGLKPFYCEICGKSFTLLPNFKRHMLIHTGEKPFECGLCQKAFRHESTRKVHETSCRQQK